MSKTALLAAVCLCATACLAATFNGTLTPTNGTGTVTWSGGPLTGVLGYEGLVGISPTCNATLCDFFNLTVSLPANFYSSYPHNAVHVTLKWDSQVQDIDLYVFDSAGNLVGYSAAGGTTGEDADLGQLPSGTYQVQVVPSSSAGTFYGGAATIGPDPAAPTGKAAYKLGNFTFTSQVLARAPMAVNSNPLSPIFLEQDAEPRVVHDDLGNIYVAAIQGVPAGTDLWKSMDGGNTFTYLGQPDGAQAAAATGGGIGIGGGDEDLVTGTTGNVYLSSLWLGSATNCVSSDGAATWLCNPMGTTLPEDDRQWLAADGANVAYVTTKQLGTLSNATPSIYVAKSIDGGKSYPFVSEVTKPLFGVQPGFQGNIVVDPNNHNVYTTFVGAYPNQVYVARSVDGGATWALKLAYQAPSGQSMSHVFPALAVDRGSNLYLTFSDGRRSLLTGSTDGGATWTTPVQVNSGANAKTSVEPWVVAGDAGKINVFYYGTAAVDFMDPGARWQIFMAQTQNFFKNVPVFYTRPATEVMHVGAICVNGTACPSGTRNLLEYFYPDTYLDGNALAAYPDDLHVDPDTTVTRAWFLKQVGGTKIAGGK